MNVKISDSARAILTHRTKRWTGWTDATLVLGPTNPAISPYAMSDLSTHVVTADPEALLLNPNRVLLTMTPFRFRQEAVLTGALLHEAAHARFTRWAKPGLTHSDGAPVTKQTAALAKVIEEARIEARMTDQVLKGNVPETKGLAWTMRATAAHLLPMTNVSADPDQAVLDVLCSWILRAVRAKAIARAAKEAAPSWVHDFDALMHDTAVPHLAQVWPSRNPQSMWQGLQAMIMTATDAAHDYHDTGEGMIDVARAVLTSLFPPPEGGDPNDTSNAPMAQGGCGEDDEPGESGESSDDTDQDQGQDAQGSGEDDEQDPDEGSDGDPSDEGSESEGSDAETGTDAEATEALNKMEAEAAKATKADAAEQAAKIPAPTREQGEDAGSDPSDGQGGLLGGARGDERSNGTWRDPSIEERDLQRSAERFLRGLISPSEASKITLSESPAATIDGAALAAWRAGGQVRDPRFFRRTQREVIDAPPVKIAVLVDVSGSMDVMQEPSAVLSWALSAAALDLRNFAGRGISVESCLIHWGSEARVVQHNGQTVRGIREVDCREGTDAMHEALDLIEVEMPGFFDVPERPEHRIIVQFTDWQLHYPCDKAVIPQLHRAFEAGVDMLSVVPQRYSWAHSDLEPIMTEIRKGAKHTLRGSSKVIQYDHTMQSQVWTEAADLLAR